MNKNELKKVLKPLIKECIKEVIFEDGTLSTIIAEVMKGTSDVKVVSENKQTISQFDKSVKLAKQNKQKQLAERRKRILDAVGSDAYNGVDLFEGTTPAPAPANQTNQQGPLSGISPSDPGVDISSLLGSANMWKKVIGK